MKKLKEKRTIEVNVIEFEDGTKIDSSIILRFLEEASEFEDTIGKDGNYTDKYLYFETKDEKKLEEILIKLDVIRKSPNHSYNNDKVGESDYYNNYYYWLSDGYHNFYEKYWDLER